MALIIGLTASQGYAQGPEPRQLPEANSSDANDDDSSYSVLAQANRPASIETPSDAPTARKSFTARPLEIESMPRPSSEGFRAPALFPDSPSEENFTQPQRGTLTASPLPPNELRSGAEQDSSASLLPIGDDRGTFASDEEDTSEQDGSFAPPVKSFQPLGGPPASQSRSENQFGASLGNGPPVRGPLSGGPAPQTNQGLTPQSVGGSGLDLNDSRRRPNPTTMPSISKSPDVASSSSMPALPGESSQPALETRSIVDPPAARSGQLNRPADLGNSGYPAMQQPTGNTGGIQRDPMVRPTRFEQGAGGAFNGPGNAMSNPLSNLPQSANTTSQSGQLSVAREWFEQYAVNGSDGDPVTLEQMLMEPLGGNQRNQMIVQYWETYYDWVALNIARDHESWVNSIKTQATPAEASLIGTARRMAADRTLAAEIQLAKAQSKLMDFMPSSRSEGFRPLPADAPLVTSYRTDFDKYTRLGRMPSRMRGIDGMLTSTVQLIGQRAQTAMMARQARTQSLGSSVATLLQAADYCRSAQLDLTASVVNYNQAIGDYVLTVEPSRSPSTLVAFMIGSNSRANDPATGSALPTRQAQLPGNSVLAPSVLR